MEPRLRQSGTPRTPLAPRRIQIVGGGLAGLTLGIELLRVGVPVTIWESGRYPRHRVCGEVLSGRGCQVLERLGLLAPMLDGGARPARTARFFNASDSSTPPFPFGVFSVCVSRYFFDHFLANRFCEMGGELRSPERWNDWNSEEGVVHASGRTPQAAESGWKWFGLKAHCRNVELTADVEMHLLPLGYVGLCGLAGGVVNVCGLFRRSSGTPQPGPSPWEGLRGMPGSTLHERLRGAEWDGNSFCSVGGLGLKPRRAARFGDCRLGDALTMIPPFTGNGMSMALEAAELAAEPLARYSRDELPWTIARQQIAAACDAQFFRRLRWSGWLHHVILSSGGRAVLPLAARSSWVWRTVFNLTR